MMERLTSPVVVVAVAVMFALAVSGCGTLLYPERLEATPSHKLDGKVVLLDCLWLLVGVLPGVIALGVDFYNDTIYLSEDELHTSTDHSVRLGLIGPAPADNLLSLRSIGQEETDPDVAPHLWSGCQRVAATWTTPSCPTK